VSPARGSGFGARTILPIRRLENARRLLDDYARVAHRYGVPLPLVLQRGVRLAVTRGFRLREALVHGLLDPSLTDDVLAGCLGKARLLELQRRVNAAERECLTEDKAVFYLHCQALGLPVPALFAVFGQQAGSTAQGRPLVGRAAWAAYLADGLPTPCVLKPAFGYYGLGVRILDRRDGALVDQDGRSLAPAALYDELCRPGTFRKFVFQEHLAPHPELRRLSGTAALQTARIVTDVEEGRVEVNHALLRIAVGSNVVDNLSGGKTGNFAAPLETRDGRLGDAWQVAPDGTGLVRVTQHPGTGVPLPGFALPDWDAALALVERAALLFLPIRCLGWDVAFTPAGPVLVEANMWWDPSNLFGLDLSPAGRGRGQAALYARLEDAALRGVADFKS